MFRKLTFFFLLPLFLVLSSCTYTFYKTSSPHPLPGALKKVSSLAPELYETSGLQAEGDSFITFNDSGGEPALYEFDKQGTVLSKTIIANARNVDWEDIAFDGTNYYVADIGNNSGKRDTLLIYKIPIDPLTKTPVSIAADSISFSYDEERNNTEGGMSSHDCEAIFCYNDSLYLFAKDWVTKNTRIYVLPTKSGHYNIKSRKTYKVNALITGADIDSENQEVVLIGYRNYFPIMIRYGYHSDPAAISSGGKARIYPLKYGSQVEGIAYGFDGTIYVSCEKSIHLQSLYRTY